MADTNTSVISIETDNEIKEKVQDVLKQYGIDIASMINMFLKNIASTRKISYKYEYELENEAEADINEKPQARLGGLEGKIWIAEDLNLPILGENEERTPVFGCAKGKIWMSDDFDEPLEEFEEYM